MGIGGIDMLQIQKSTIRMVWYKDTLKDIRDYCERFLGTNKPLEKIKEVIDARLKGDYIDLFEEDEV